MNSLIALALLLAPADVAAVALDPDVLAETLALDAEVAASLRESGDDPAAVRPVDVRFTGTPDAVGLLEQDAGDLGWVAVQTEPLEDGSLALDLQREQSADDDALRELTETALRIEAAYGVLYEGWSAPAVPAGAP